MRSRLLRTRAFSGPTKTSEISQPGNTSLATFSNGKPVTLEVWRVLLCITTPVILALTTPTLPDLLRGGVNLPELHELVVLLAANLGDECTLVLNIL